jgi:germination protein M
VTPMHSQSDDRIRTAHRPTRSLGATATSMYQRGRWSLLAAAVLAIAACGSSKSATSPTTQPPTATPAVSVPPTTGPPSTGPAATSSAESLPSSTAAPAATTLRYVDVKTYFLRDGRLVIGHRQVSAPAVLRGALSALTAGPTTAETGEGVGSALPPGTRLLDVGITEGQATIDLSGEFAGGGGSSAILARVAQVVFTATQFPNVDRVVLWLDGVKLDTLGGEGLVVSEPLTRSMISRDISGSVIIDTPSPGSTVQSPFVVTGEGDVYEAQFPIEVWSGDQQVGGVAPVTAGAWGTWADFEVTIMVDAPSGPVQLVAYDPGGCGTDPECPPIIKTVVPLNFVDSVPSG